VSSPICSADFVGSVGVVANLGACNAPARAMQAVSAMQYLGIGNLRSPFSAALVLAGSDTIVDFIPGDGDRIDL